MTFSAYEMSRNNNYLVTYFDGKPQMSSVKPPLLTWLQVGFIKLIGFSELAIRLPSALAAVLTFLVIIIFSIVYFRNYQIGLFAVLTLVTSDGYLLEHASRSGEYDALLCLFTTLFSLSLFLYIDTKKKSYLHLFFIALSLAVLTKGVQGLIFMPAIIIYIILKRQLAPLLLSKWLYIDGAFFLMITVGYYLLHEHETPGYIQAVWDNELGGRFLKVNEGNSGSFGYYLNRMYTWTFKYWIWMVPLGILVGWSSNKLCSHDFTIFATLFTTAYLLIISFSQTKLYWYAIPSYPFMALLVALFVYRFYLFVDNVFNSQALVVMGKILLLLVVFAFPYLRILGKVYNNNEHEWDKEVYPICYLLQRSIYDKLPNSIFYNMYTQANYTIIMYFDKINDIRLARDSKKPLHVSRKNDPGHIFNLDSNAFIVYPNYNHHIKIYANVLNDLGQKVTFKNPYELKQNDEVLASQSEMNKLIKQKYRYQLASLNNGVLLYRINKILK